MFDPIESSIISGQTAFQLGSSKPQQLNYYRKLFQSDAEAELLWDIRYALNQGLILGTEQFNTAVED